MDYPQPGEAKAQMPSSISKFSPWQYWNSSSINIKVHSEINVRNKFVQNTSCLIVAYCVYVRLWHWKIVSVYVHEREVSGGSGRIKEEELLWSYSIACRRFVCSISEDVRVGGDRKDISYTICFDESSCKFRCVVAYLNSEKLCVSICHYHSEEGQNCPYGSMS